MARNNRRDYPAGDAANRTGAANNAFGNATYEIGNEFGAAGATGATGANEADRAAGAAGRREGYQGARRNRNNGQ